MISPLGKREPKVDIQLPGIAGCTPGDPNGSLFTGITGDQIEMEKGVGLTGTSPWTLMGYVPTRSTYAEISAHGSAYL